MKMNSLPLTFAAVALALCCINGERASADIFFDNFESVSPLSSPLWASNSSGQVVLDLLDASNHAVHFTQKTRSGDLFSKVISYDAGILYRFEFDYLGTGPNAGGFAGFWPADVWYFGTAPFNSGGVDAFVMTNNNLWHHYSYDFTPGTAASQQLMFEDWAGVDGNAGDAYFDNVQVSAVESAATPEPGAVTLFVSSGIVGAGLLRRRRQQKGQKR
jgi:hypothetical protein